MSIIMSPNCSLCTLWILLYLSKVVGKFHVHDDPNRIQNCSSLLHIPMSNFHLQLEGEDQRNKSNYCPPWYLPAANGTCQFGSTVGNVVSFVPPTLQTRLQYLYCVTVDDTDDSEALGGCLIFPKYIWAKMFTLPCNRAELNDFMCGAQHRQGQLCGRCKDGFAAPVYSYSIKCVECTDYTYNWLKYLAMAFGPLTLFLLVVTVFHVSSTSPHLHGYILFCHILCSPNINRIYQQGHDQSTAKHFYSKYGVVEVALTLCGIWNLDFFRLVYEPFCIHPNMTFMEAIALDYIIAFYPLALIAVTYLLVYLHSNNYRIVICIWKPFRYRMRRFLRALDIQASLIDSFATLFLLSSIKFQSVSFDLLLPTSIHYPDGSRGSKLYLFSDGHVEYFGKEHLPFAITALFVVVFLVLLPVLLLLLYPCKPFTRLLNMCRCNCHALRAFMDVFLGRYKDRTNNTRDLRYFAAVFFLTRTIFLALFSYFSPTLSITITGIVFIALLFSISVLHPHTSKAQYRVDCIFITFAIAISISLAGGDFLDFHSLSYYVSYALTFSILFLSQVYLFFHIFYWIFVIKKWPQGLFKKVTSRRKAHFYMLLPNR